MYSITVSHHFMIAHSLAGVGGETELAFEPEGLRCRIQLPLASAGNA